MDERIIREFLRIDDSEDIGFYVETAKEYIKEAVGICDETNKLTQYAICAVTQELYDKRVMTTDQRADQKRRIINSILVQLRLKNFIAEEDGDES